MQWFFDDHAKLVCHMKNGTEVRYIIYEMRRLPRKNFKGRKSNFWSFNNYRIIVDESMFDWESPGLRGTLQKHSKRCAEDEEQAKSTLLFFSQILPRNSNCIQTVHHTTSEQAPTTGTV